MDEQILITHSPRGTRINFGRIIVGAGATLIRPENESRLSISIVNNSGDTVYIGDNDTVTPVSGTNPGYELLPQSEFNTEYHIGDIYGIVSSGTVTLTYWEEVEQ